VKVKFKIEYYPDGTIKVKYPFDGEKINGNVTEYYKNGDIKSIVSFKDNLQDGKAIFYYANGSLQREAYFKKGIQQDTMKVYYENGNIRERSYLINGVKEGQFEEYYENGIIKSSGCAQNNLRFGNWDFYTLNNEIDYHAYFNEGELVSKYFFRNDSIIYQNEKFGYQFTIPQKFHKEREKLNYVVFSITVDSLKFKPSVSIIAQKVQKSQPLSSFVEKEIESIRDKTISFTMKNRESLLRSSLNGYQINYIAKYDEYEVSVSSTFVKESDMIFSITCMSDVHSYSSHFSSLRNYINLFKVVDKKL